MIPVTIFGFSLATAAWNTYWFITDGRALFAACLVVNVGCALWMLVLIARD